VVLDAVVDRFLEHSPITVMARLALQRALEPVWIDDLFEQARETQHTRELLFSTTVEIISLVAVGLRPSVHAAAKASPALPVSITALIGQDQPDRAWAGSCLGARQRPAVGPGSATIVANPTSIGEWLSIEHFGWQPCPSSIVRREGSGCAAAFK
jgi:hypothetical protein